MAYVPITRGTFKALGEVHPIAMFRPSRGASDWMLYTSERFICYIACDHFGDAYDGTSDAGVIGLCYENIIIEVDDETLIDTNRFDLPLGALIRTPEGWGIVSRVYTQSMSRYAILDVDGKVGDYTRNALGYASWRIMIEERGKLQQIAQITAGGEVRV